MYLYMKTKLEPKLSSHGSLVFEAAVLTACRLTSLENLATELGVLKALTTNVGII